MNAKEVLWYLCGRGPLSVFHPRRLLCVPNVSWGLLPWEADLIIVQPSGYLTEVEIKVSKSDFKNDINKKKHRLQHPRIRNFYYAMPADLWERCGDVARVSGSGIISVGERSSLIVRPQPNKAAQPITEHERRILERLLGLRFWSHYKKFYGIGDGV